MHDAIALIGLSGSGKTTVGPLVAQALGWPYDDTDRLAEAAAAQPIAAIFAAEGEAAFRTLERQALATALSGAPAVIATGGGIIEAAENRALLRERAFTVWLHAPPEQLATRLAGQTDRPLLSDDPAARLAEMAARRTPLYAAAADWIVATADLTPQQIADEILRAYRLRQPALGDAIQVTTPGGSYAVRAASGAWEELPARLEQLELRGRVWLVSDSHVLPRYGEQISALLAAHDRTVQSYAIPAGEQHKTLTTVRAVYDWLLERGVERGDVLLALGGGVVGDLAGFVAATVLRGIALVQLPTTVLAMVDSAIGGKTGVDHQAGKNLIGAFHQPRLVLADTRTLATLAAAERAAGWAEALKHGVIGDAALFADLQHDAPAALALAEPTTGRLIQRAAAYKARVVSGDEREQGGRIMLNYGHTIGHALEAESGYSLRHGEAIAIGMMAAGAIAERLGLFPTAALDRQRAALAAFGLPTRIPATIDPQPMLARIASDKKVRARRVRWVLPTAIGAATVRDDVPPELVTEIVSALRG